MNKSNYEAQMAKKRALIANAVKNASKKSK